MSSIPYWKRLYFFDYAGNNGSGVFSLIIASFSRSARGQPMQHMKPNP
jgi:hypothetical protein